MTRLTRTGRRRRWALMTTIGVTAALAAVVPLGAAAADTSPPVGTPATVSADVLPTWQVNGVVWGQVVVGNTVYVDRAASPRRGPPGVAAGGAGEVAANNIFAYDITTGNRVASFSHSLNAQGLDITRSPDGSRVYVVGDFTTVDGVAAQPHRCLQHRDRRPGQHVLPSLESAPGPTR